VESKILGKMLKSGGPTREHRRPVTPKSDEGDPRRPESSRREVLARRAMCAIWRMRAPARVGRAPENGFDAKFRLVVPGRQKRADQTRH
jgi:hypothetical protein